MPKLKIMNETSPQILLREFRIKPCDLAREILLVDLGKLLELYSLNALEERSDCFRKTLAFSLECLVRAVHDAQIRLVVAVICRC